MKKIFLFIAITCVFLLAGTQRSHSQPFKETALPESTEFFVSDPFPSSSLPSDGFGIFLRNEWGGSDAPDPEEESSTGAETPVGKGVFILIIFALIYSLLKIKNSRQKNLENSAVQ